MPHSDSMSDLFEPKALHDAAQSGNIEEVRRLLVIGQQPNEFDDLGKTPLHYAAEHGYLEVMESLINTGANVNAHDERVITVVLTARAGCAIGSWLTKNDLKKFVRKTRT